MACNTSATSSADTQRLRDLENRVRRLESGLSGIREIYGVCATSAELRVPVLEFLRSVTTGKFTVKFSSMPNESYQIQISTNGVDWTIANGGNFVQAATGTAVMTSWTTTDAYDLEDLPVYFRVRRYPVAGGV